MNTLKFLSHLKSLGIELLLESDDRIRFRAKKGGLTEELKRELGARKAEIVEILKQARKRPGPGRPLISKVERDRKLPLSFAQERLWLIQQMNPDDASYNMPQAFRLEGPLDVYAVGQCLRAMVDRHEALRTRFERDGDGLHQIVEAPSDPSIAVVDLSSLSHENRKSLSRTLTVAAICLSFALDRQPLLRTLLFRQGPHDHVLLLNMHHIVADAISLGLAFGEFTVFYRSLLSGTAARLPELPIQYADYAHWQRQWLAGETLERELAHWEERLAGAPSELALTPDLPRPPVQTFAGAVHDFQLPSAALSKLTETGAAGETTPFMTGLAAYAALLGHYSGQQDVLVGAPVANRQGAQTEGLIGFFVNTLVFRVDLAGDPTIRELLARVRDTALTAYAHQQVPFEKLVERLQPRRDPSRPALFQALLALETDTAGPEGRIPALPGLRVSPQAFDHHVAKFDLSLHIRPGRDGISAQFNYNRDLFLAETVAAMARHLGNMLARATPHTRLSRLSWLDAAESRRLLTGWNDTATPYPRNRPIHALFADCARSAPDSAALATDGSVVTYAALHAWSGRIAAVLASRGLGRETPVAVLMTPGPPIAAALLGILKAGGAYLPLDTGYPEERLARMLEDAAATAVLTHLSPAGALPGNGIEQIDISALRYGEPATETGFPQTSGDGLAYLMYTSGSTGRPKGVAVPHRAVVRLVRNTGYLDFSPRAVFLQASSVSFDAATLEIWGSLLNGAKLVSMAGRSLEALPELLIRHRVSVLWLTAQLFHMMMDEHPDSLAGVRQLLAGGDVLSPEHVRRHRGRFPENRLINGYGPTENTTFTCCADLDGALPEGRSAPIGVPIANTRVFILDRFLRPVPRGVSGELTIGGDGLARGYHNRPGLTASRFMPHPHGLVPGERLYRTGDRTRYLPDGSIEFGGRIDRQVKLRGFRIELGEIEHHLRRVDGVRDALVRMQVGEDGDKRLLAYTVGETQDAETLKRYLSERLPEFMVPSGFVALAAFPLTPNGKIDLKALPEPGPGGGDDRPRTPVQEVLAAIWSQVLGVDNIGIGDNFFEIGGHSLRATQVVTRIREAFQVVLPLADLFRAPTIGDLATLVEDALRQGGAAPPPEIRPRATAGEDPPLSFAQQRLWFLHQLEEAKTTYNMAFVLRFRGSLDLATLERSVNKLAERHETLRTLFPAVDGAPVQKVLPHRFRRLPVPDLSGLAAGSRQTLTRALADSASTVRFDLAEGPLFHIAATRIDRDDHLLVATLHHIAGDGWSLGIMVRELAESYRAFPEGTEPQLPALPIQYGDYAAWQRQWLQGETLARQEAFWKRHLEGAPDLLALPTDRARPSVRTFNGRWLPFQLDAATGHRLRQTSREAGTTLFMTLQAAFLTLLSRYSGQTDIVLGIPVANRHRGEIEPLVGFFVNTLALRHDLSGEPCFADLLARVRATALAGYAHQDLPFEQVVETLQPERVQSYSPLFQVSMVYQNAPRAAWTMPGCEIGSVGLDQHTSKFDLTLFFEESGEGLEGSFEYNTDLFDATTVRRMLAHFRTLLRNLCETPNLPVPRIAMMSETESHQTLCEWNATEKAVPAGLCCHHFLERQARLNGEAVALQQSVPGGRDRFLSYAMANARADTLAGRLRREGVLPDLAVGLCAGRTLEMAVAVAAILKAGGACLPLDPAYPQRRLDFMMEDSNAGLLLCSANLKDRLPGYRGPRIVLEDEQASVPPVPQPATPVPESSVYLLYTSGSTGKPKGVVMPHRVLVNILLGQERSLSWPARTLQFAALSFDVSFQEIFSTQHLGGTLVLIPERVRIDPAELWFLIAQRAVARMFLPFVALNQLAEAAMERGIAPRYPREVVASGEQLRITEAIERLFRSVPNGLLVNQYGPTETHVAIDHLCSSKPGVEPRLPPLGTAMDNDRAYLLDRAMEPIAIGIEGQVYLGGEAPSRGFHRRPARTAAGFLPDPFSAKPGARMYRTGDLARYLRNGKLDFLGRADQQVKLRGFRVELGEVEAVCAGHQGIREAAATVFRDSETGIPTLVAYLVPEPGVPPATEEDLRWFLKSRLPAYMVPGGFAFLDKLPLTPSGKLNRRALPKPVKTVAAAAGTGPRDEIETVLALIWCEVLACERVGVHDNFFDLGGHSLLAARVVSRIRALCRADLPVRALFETPTVAGLASAVKRARREEPPFEVKDLTPVSREKPLPLSFSQQRLWFLDRLGADRGAYNLSFALRLRGPLLLAALEAALDGSVERHEALRTRFFSEKGVPVQATLPHEPMSLPLVDLGSRSFENAEALVRDLAAREAQRPFDLTRPPHLRALILRLSPSDHVLLGTMHHIVSDGWSIGVLVGELTEAYRARAAGLQPQLPELEIQYPDYAVWQRGQLDGKGADRQIAFWRERLAGMPSLLALPTDRPRPHVQDFRGASLPLSLEPDTVRDLRQLGKRLGTSMFMNLAAGVAALLGRYSGQADVALGVPVANRPHKALEPLIGFFTNTLVLRHDLSGNPSFAQLLDRARRTTLDAMDHGDLPFEQVVEAVQPVRSLSHSPLFQAMFALQNAPVQTLSIPGLTVTAPEMEQVSAKFDLTLSLEESGDEAVGILEYNTTLFDRATIMRLRRHFKHLLAVAAADPDRPLSRLALADASERHLLLREWNDTESTAATGLRVHEMVASAAARRPDAVVLVAGRQWLSHAGLENRANRLARCLRAAGLGPEKLAGICMPRESETVATLLAILKTGGAYLPLDPEYPRERLAYTLADADAALLVTRQGVLEAPPAEPTAMLTLEALQAEAARASGNRLDIPGHDAQLSHLIYTSGSTGKPKGVAIAHANTTAMLDWAGKAFGPERLNGVLAATSLCFDLSVFEIFAPLAHGGLVVMADNVLHLADPEAKHLVTLVNTVPSAMTELVRTDAVPDSVRVVNLAGEPLPAVLVRQLLGHRSVCEVFNLYGPSEDTTYSTYGKMQADRDVPAIGRPVANTRVYLVDEALTPVPSGAAGELCLSGSGVVRGYHARPQLTAERFAPDPFEANRPGSRIYRTGDLARYRADGELAFLGRADHQVKLRGFRIELGEIESVLLAHETVAEAAVAVREGAAPRLIAYLSPAEGDPARLRAYLGNRLPAFMVPSQFVFLDRLPRTPNGKIDRGALPDPDSREPGPAAENAEPRSELQRLIASIWREVLGRQTVGAHDNFFDLGGHSLLVIQVHERLSAQLAKPPTLVELFQYPTVAAMAAYLEQRESSLRMQTEGGERAARRRVRFNEASGSDIAIIGLACRFPGAPDIAAFWRNLRDGVESVSFFSDEELVAAGVDPALLQNPNYVKAGAVLADADRFDAAFFDIAPREAEIMDPQHRLFLECAWQALEHAGYAPGTHEKAVGVFAGSAMNTYLLHQLLPHPELLGAIDPVQAMFGNDKDFLPSRVSYKLNLKGVSVNVQSACSTSLLAVHLACQSLLAGECDMALAGGVSLDVQQSLGYLYQEEHIQSPDGHCRAFDAEAKGTVSGNGLGAVVLKPLDRALADRDHIFAVIKASAANNDGACKVGYTAPSVEGQAEVIAEALAMAGIAPETLGYLEAHGTGTLLGDPIEIAALNKAFEGRFPPAFTCPIGTVKSNFGHLNTAAGVAGLVKTVLALQHRQIPPSLHYNRANPKIPFENGPFFVNSGLKPWHAPKGGGKTEPRRAGVSSFGIGGTNIHVILEEAPAMPAPKPEGGRQVLVLSAKTRAALKATGLGLADYLESHPQTPLEDIAYTLQVGRAGLAERRFVVCRTRAEAVSALREEMPSQMGTHRGGLPPAVFMFSGQGSQYANMGRELYEHEMVFREQLDRCFDLLEPLMEAHPRTLLFPDETDLEAAEERLRGTDAAQPLLFAVEYALARLWMSWGVKPQAMIGHSIGEYAAACLAGVFSLEDALTLVHARGRLMALMPPGAMLAVPLGETEAASLLSGGLALAAVNAGNRCVISGPCSEIASLQQRLERDNVASRMLATSHAFHSPTMEPMMREFGAVLAKVAMHPPQVPMISNLTGNWLKREEAVSPEYWLRHLRETVRFEQGLGMLLRDPDRVLLEVGPGHSLCAFAKGNKAWSRERSAVASLPGGDGRREHAGLLSALGKLWLAGVPVDWQGVHGGKERRRVPLPTYPFESKRYWFEPAAVAPRAAVKTAPDDWFYLPVWRVAPPLPDERKPHADPILVLTGDSGLGEDLVGVLEKERPVVKVCAASGFANPAPDRFAIDPGKPEDFRKVLQILADRDALPRHILHLWSLSDSGLLTKAGAVAETMDLGFYSLLYLARALSGQVLQPVAVTVIADGLAGVTPDEPVVAEKSSLLGLCKVIPQENPHLECRVIDTAIPGNNGWRRHRLPELLAAELIPGSGEPLIVHRGNQRWIPDFERVKQPPGPSLLREGGVYLITGGLGRIGRTLARYLAKSVRAKLALIGRGPAPAADPAVDENRKLLRDLEELGAEAVYLSADVANETEMAAAVADVAARFGTIRGVFHAAGVPRQGGFKPAGDLERADCERHFQSKLRGLTVLADAVSHLDLDFGIAFSSLASMLGGLGFGAYAAANQFMDAFVHEHNRQGRYPWLSINWDGWNFDPEEKGGLAALSITPDEGERVFERLFQHNQPPQLAIATHDLKTRVRNWVRREDRTPKPGSAAPAARHSRPDLATPFAEPRNETERKILEIWRSYLGFERIGIHDNFYELGGDSLLATQVFSRLRETFEVALPLATLFEEPTVAGLAGAIGTVLSMTETTGHMQSTTEEDREGGRI